jgi:SpoIID/LytB domain protein
MKEPLIEVGILSGREIEFTFARPFTTPEGQSIEGLQKASCEAGKIQWHGSAYDELTFTPPSTNDDAYFELKEVTIGIRFHWERKEAQRFRGSLRLIVEETEPGSGEMQLTAVNILPIETYLTCVIASEMNAHAPLEFLKAHAVIARSWALDKLRVKAEGAYPEHAHYDVCADDHCQRYQGITRASTPQAVEAVAATRGEALMYDGTICDTRYSKCCGGAMELFSSCWEEKDYPYLIGKRDLKEETPLPDLTNEEEAEQWIRTSPPAFCNTHDEQLLARVLNSYDRETPDFYRWQVSYTQQELSELLRNRLQTELGEIVDLLPLKRGTSGRIVRLEIKGTKRTVVVEKELAIRRALSATHLYSSAFVVDKEGSSNIPTHFHLTGAGWGHGVGLCQIGAAVMGAQGYSYPSILSHYYPKSELKCQYL